MNLDTEVHSLLYKNTNCKWFNHSHQNTYFGLLTCTDISVFLVWHSTFTALRASRVFCIAFLHIVTDFSIGVGMGSTCISVQFFALIAIRSLKDDYKFSSAPSLYFWFALPCSHSKSGSALGTFSRWKSSPPDTSSVEFSSYRCVNLA